MRYAFQHTTKTEQKNNLNSEIENIKKYIEIQSIRFRKYNNIKTHFEGEFSRCVIEPLLLLTFVENAFKYVNIKKGPLEIKIALIENHLTFYTSNYYEKNHSIESSKLGIKNTRQKLNILYPNRHQLEIKDNGETYTVLLHLNLS